MSEALRTSKFAKDPDDEQRLAEMNQLLQPLQASLDEEASPPRHPLVLVIGAPRSGTTLAGQMLAFTGGFAYISNFLARFWQAPAVGARIEQALKIGQAEAVDFRSSYGVTEGWANSHEFGYFWTSWFGRGQDTHRLAPTQLAQIDADAFRRSIGAIEAVRDRPLVFKNNTWCTLQAAYLARMLPMALFVVCRRAPLFLAQSLLTARRERYGGDSTWWSVRPSTYAGILRYPPHHQVVFQALEIQREMDEELAGLSPHRIVEAPYERLCGSPRAVVAEVAERCEAMGCAVQVRHAPPERFTSTDVRRLPEADWQRFEQALADYPAFLSQHGIVPSLS